MANGGFAMAVVLAIAVPVGLSAFSAKRRGNDAAATVTESLIGLGSFLVALWYASSLWSISTFAVAVAGFVAAAIVVCGIPAGVPTRGRPPAAPLALLIAIGLVLVICCLVPFLPYGMERADGVHRLSMTDWEKHLMFTTELVAFDEMPPSNPFLRSAGASPYYAGFQLLASLPARAAGVPRAAYPALLGLMILTALLVPVVAYTTSRELIPDARTAAIAAVAVAVLGGFDLVPLALDALGNLFRHAGIPDSLADLREIVPSINPDSWLQHNERQFDPPYRNAIWAPQHLLGGLMAMAALSALWRARERGRPARAFVPIGIALVATAMLSAYTAIAIGVGLSAVAVWDWVAGRADQRRGPSSHWWVAGVTALVAGLPFATQLANSPSAGLTAAVSAAGTWGNGAFFTAALGDGVLARLLDTPMLLVVELGLIGVLGITGLRRAGDRQAARVVVFVLAVIALAVLLRPPVGGPNNLYPRALLLVWILLAPYAAATARSMSRPLLTAALIPCLLYTPYAMVGATLEGYLFWGTPLADHAVAAWIEEGTAPSTVVAFAPEERPTYGTYWTRRPVVFHDSRLALLFGATDDQVEATEAALAAAYVEVRPRLAAEAFRDLGADLVVVDATTPQARAWAASPCFITGYRSDSWMAAAPEPEACPR